MGGKLTFGDRSMTSRCPWLEGPESVACPGGHCCFKHPIYNWECLIVASISGKAGKKILASLLFKSRNDAPNSVAFCCPFLKASLRSSFTFRARVRGSCLTRSVNGVAAVRGAANSHSSSLNRLEVLIKGVNTWCQVYTYSEVYNSPKHPQKG